MEIRSPQGLFDRVLGMLEVVDKLPESISDEESDGLVNLLPPDVARSIGAMLAPHIRPASIVFLKMVAKWVFDAKKAPEQGKKVIIAPFNFPVEFIHIFENAYPLTSEVMSSLGVVALEGQGERYFDMALSLGLPDHICSSNTIELGSMLGSEDFRPQAIISAAPGGCDVNAKIHEFVSNYMDIPQFILQKPPDDSPRGMKQYVKYTKLLLKQLEDFIGEKLDENRMRKVFEYSNRCTELYYELMDLHKNVPTPVPNIFSLYIYTIRFTLWGTEDGVRTMEAMVELSKKRLAEKKYRSEKENARCIWAYTSYYYDFMSLYDWMETKGYAFLGDGLDLFFPQPVDTTNMETMIEGLAALAWNMPMTRQVGAQSMAMSWSHDVVHTAKELKADCAIYCGHHSCKQTWSVVSILREELQKRLGIPLLVLQGDSWLKNMTPIGVIQERMDEFIQNVVVKKKAPRRRVRKRKPTKSE